jgi:AraC-like DNA-binding protein
MMGDHVADIAVGAAREMRGFDLMRDAALEPSVALPAKGSEHRTFAGSITLAELGPLVLAQIATDAHSVGRTNCLTGLADPDRYRLIVQIAGKTVLRQDAREALLTPGDLAFYDARRPYELRFDAPFQMNVLVPPRALLQVPEPSLRMLTCRRITGNTGLGALIGPFIAGLTHQVGRRAAAVNHRLSDAVLDMLAATLADEVGAFPSSVNGPRQAALLEQVKSYIESQLADTDLGPAMIAAAHHISPRYLRKLFEGEGDSVARWIRSRRLDRCRSDLARPDLCDRSVSAVAAHWGFTDAAHFSRLFKSAFGQSPREYRSAALASAWRPMSSIA